MTIYVSLSLIIIIITADRRMDREEEVGKLALRAGRACEGVQHGWGGCVDRGA
jgi:hypothetical protein